MTTIHTPQSVRIFTSDGETYLRYDDDSYLQLDPLLRLDCTRHDTSHALSSPDAEFLEAVGDVIGTVARTPPALGCDRADALGTTVASGYSWNVEPADADVVLVTGDAVDPFDIASREARHLSAGRAVHRIIIEDGVAFVGPLSYGSTSVRWDDICRRRRSTTANPRLHDDFRASAVSAPVPRQTILLAAGLVIADLLDGRAAHLLRVVRPDGVITTHPVLPWPSGVQRAPVP